MLGFIKEVSPVFSALDIFVLPSRNEGLGTVLLEAAFAKVVLIASNVGGIGEVVIHHKTGCLIEDSTEQKGFTESIIKTIENNELKELLIENSYQHVSEKFGLSNMAIETAKLYK